MFDGAPMTEKKERPKLPPDFFTPLGTITRLGFPSRDKDEDPDEKKESRCR